MQQDQCDPVQAWIADNFLQPISQGPGQLRDRRCLTQAAEALGQLIPWQSGTVEHRIEQLGFILEMPIDRSARQPCSLGDLLKGGLGVTTMT
ncbi:hypothetical protein D9M73_232620 [compost metagenome]